MRYQLLIQSLLLTVMSFAQSEISNRLKCKGEIPEVITGDYISGTKGDIKSDTLIKKKKKRKEFYSGNNYALRNFYQSGYLLFGDEITKFSEKVLEKLAEDNPEIKTEEITMFTFRSSTPNAFTTSDGSVFISTALIARLNSEDELAFVIAHEVAHYLKKHVISQYNFSTSNKERKSSKEKNLDRLLRENQYSKKLEIEADLLGLTMFENSNYSWTSLSPLFNLLKQAEIPTFKIDSALRYIEKGAYEINDSIYYKVAKPTRQVEAGEEGDDKYSTHPAPSYRLKLLLDKSLKRNDDITRSNQFNEIVKIARFELLDQYIQEFDYYSGLYLNYSMQQQYGPSEYLDYLELRCLYGIAKFRNLGKNTRIEPSLNKRYHDEMNRMYDLFRFDFAAEEIHAIFLAKSNNYAKGGSNYTEEFNAMAQDILASSKIGDYESEFFKINKAQLSKNEYNYDQDKVITLNKKNEDTVQVISGIITHNPNFFRLEVDRKKEGAIEYGASTKNQEEYINIANSAVSRFGLNSYVSDINTLKPDDVEGYNTSKELNLIMNEYSILEHFDTFVSYNSKSTLGLIENHGVTHMIVPTTINVKLPKSGAEVFVTCSLMFFVWTIPVCTYFLIQPNEHSVFQIPMYDLRSGTVVYNYENYMELRANKSTIDANFNVMLNEIISE